MSELKRVEVHSLVGGDYKVLCEYDDEMPGTLDRMDIAQALERLINEWIENDSIR